MKKTTEWKKFKWPFNGNKPYCDWECWPYCDWECWQLGKIILYPGLWPDEGWSYVANFGANSDRSHSGFLKGFISIDSAKAEIERLISIGRF